MCPIMKREISTTSVCPFATTVDNIAIVGKRGPMHHQPHFIPKKKGCPAAQPVAPGDGKFDYEAFAEEELDKKHKDVSASYYNRRNRIGISTISIDLQSFSQQHIPILENT